MTEERMKELAEECWQKHVFPINKWTGLLQFGSAVAAEARQEGIEEMREIAEVAVYETWGKRPVPYTHSQLRTKQIVAIRRKAERLKEQG
jgi:hypothetical protein